MSLSLPFSGSPSSSFGYRRIKIKGVWINHLHDGTDWAVGYGTPLPAMGDGVVDFVTYTSTRGYQIGLRHPSGEKSGYNLCRYRPGLTPGTPVHKGQTIAYSGPQVGWETSGAAATGPHVHAWYKNPAGIFEDMRARLRYNFATDSATEFDNTEPGQLPPEIEEIIMTRQAAIVRDYVTENSKGLVRTALLYPDGKATILTAQNDVDAAVVAHAIVYDLEPTNPANEKPRDRWPAQLTATQWDAFWFGYNNRR